MKNEEFMNIISDAWVKIVEKSKTYGDSWRVCTIDHLERKLREEMTEIFQAGDLCTKSKECLDVINIAVMLALRYKEEAKKEF